MLSTERNVYSIPSQLAPGYYEATNMKQLWMISLPTFLILCLSFTALGRRWKPGTLSRERKSTYILLLRRYQSAKCILHTGLFLPRVIFAFLHSQTVLPPHEFTQTVLCLKRDNLGIRIRSVLNLPADNDDKTFENKMGSKISLYTVQVPLNVVTNENNGGMVEWSTYCD